MNKQEDKDIIEPNKEYKELDKASKFIVRSKPARKRFILDDYSYEPGEVSYKVAFYCVYPKSPQYMISKSSKDEVGLEDSALARIVDDFFRDVFKGHVCEKVYDIKGGGKIYIKSREALTLQQLGALRRDVASFNYSCSKENITDFSERESR